ncbi:MAG TPA: bifunctional hydroxymethylpyrimidine kinase/phosphomethylpyrimidine kinase, partial [Pyrinomonadaceae bacterium]|nr:bifunctional hydroxymethylpyrimidine kinase/phosphomethylpyrimidine kinase [Pyrinomonadaceae bacterium]
MATSKALTIAGFDPSGGAGVLADVRTFAAFGLQSAAAITSITFQNNTGVFGAMHQTPEAVSAQIQPLLENLTVTCAKTGMLPTREVVLEVARLFRETDLPAPVVDPVIRSSSGQSLMDEAALDQLVTELIPLARLVTPNIPEAETLTATAIASEADMRNAAAAIRKLGARAVLIKGGHLAPGDAIDVLDDEGNVTVFREQRIEGAELHGSGCILSAAIAAGLGKG